MDSISISAVSALRKCLILKCIVSGLPSFCRLTNCECFESAINIVYSCELLLVVFQKFKSFCWRIFVCNTKTDEYREFSNLVWTVFDSLNCSISHSRQHFISLAGSLMLTNSKTHFNELQIALSTFGIVFLIYLELHESDSVFAPIWAGICTWFAKSSFFDWLNSSANLWPLLKSNKAEFVFSYMLRLYKRPKSNSLTPNLTQLSVQSLF